MPTYNLRRQAQTDSSSVIAIMADTNRSVAVLLNPPSPTTTTTTSSSSFSYIIALNQRQRRSARALLLLLLATFGLVMRSDDVGTPHDGDAVESESSVRVRFYRRFFGREPVGCVRGACPSVSVFSLIYLCYFILLWLACSCAPLGSIVHLRICMQNRKTKDGEGK